MSLPIEQSILISGAKTKSGSLVSESTPGSDSVNVSNYETDVGKVINISDYADGLTGWINNSLPDTLNWRKSANGNGVWIVVNADAATNGLARSTDNGNTWTLIPGLASNGVYTGIDYGNGVFCAAGTRMMKSIDDGLTWTEISRPDATAAYTDIKYANNTWIAVASTGTNRVAKSTDDADSFSAIASAEQNTYRGVAWGNNVWCAVSSDGTNRVMRSTDNGDSWSAIVTPEQNQYFEIDYGNGNFCAVSSDDISTELGAYVMRSPDLGLNWSLINCNIGGTWGGIAYGNGNWIISGNVQFAGDPKIQASTDDGLSFAFIDVPLQAAWLYLTYSSGIWLASGNTTSIMVSGGDLQNALDDVNGTTTTAIQIDNNGLTFTPLANLTLSADTIIQGYPFTLSGNGFASIDTHNLTLQNCVHPFLLEAGTETIILDHCTIIRTSGKCFTIGNGTLTMTGCRMESGDEDVVTIDANTATMTLNLLITITTKNALISTGVAASLADIDVENNTLIGDVDINDSGSGGLERYRDNIIIGNVTASVDILTGIESGNIVGTTTGITRASRVISVNALFQDTTDYKVQRIIDGFNFDSPMVQASLFNNTSQGVPRDLGAWNFDDTGLVDVYSISKYLPRPSQIGEPTSGTISKGLEVMAREEMGISGALDVYNNPVRQKDIIMIHYAGLEVEYWLFIKQLISENNTEVRVSLDPETLTSDTVSITANGATASGSAVLPVTSTKAIPTGAIFTLSSVEYRVMYPIPLAGTTTSLVLDKILENAVAASDAITVSYPDNVGIYKLSPQNVTYEEIRDGLVHNLNLRFIRKVL